MASTAFAQNGPRSGSAQADLLLILKAMKQKVKECRLVAGAEGGATFAVTTGGSASMSVGYYYARNSVWVRGGLGWDGTGPIRYHDSAEAEEFVTRAMSALAPVGCFPRLKRFDYPGSKGAGAEGHMRNLAVQVEFLMEGYPLDDWTQASAVFDANRGMLLELRTKLARRAVLVKTRPAGQSMSRDTALAEAKSLAVPGMGHGWEHSLRWVIEPDAGAAARWTLAHVFKKPAQSFGLPNSSAQSMPTRVFVEAWKGQRAWLLNGDVSKGPSVKRLR